MRLIAAAAFAGWAAEPGWTRTIVTTVSAMLVGEALIHSFGPAWLSRFPLPVSALDAGLIPFIPGDIHKLARAGRAAAGDARGGPRAPDRRRLTRHQPAFATSSSSRSR